MDDLSISGRHFHGKYFDHSKKLEKLETLYKKISEVAQRTVPDFGINIEDPEMLAYVKKRIATALRTQEHLLRDASKLPDQVNDFLDALEKKEGGGFDVLRKELKNMQQDIELADVSSKLALLKNNESLWIGAGTSMGGHTMMMRFTKHVEKNQVLYDLQFANTGLGINENENFHPFLDVDKKTKNQIVAVIKNISPQKLIECDFFNRYKMIAKTGDENLAKLGEDSYLLYMTNKMHQATSKTDELRSEIVLDKEEVLNDEEAELLINKLYQLLSELGKPVNLTDIDNGPILNSKYFSCQQIGSSCAPSSIWAIAKTILSSDELKELKTEMRLESLLDLYENIKSGYDQSLTTKILVLDQIEKLTGLYKKNRMEKPLIFSKIENELKTDLNMINPEVHIEKYPEMELDVPSEDLIYWIFPREIELESDNNPHLLVADIGFWKNEDAIPYKIEPLKGGKLRGVGLLDKCYLLYHSIISSDQSKSYEHLKTLLSALGKTKKKLKSDKLDQTFDLLVNLADQIKSVDKTRSGIAKTLFLYELAHFLTKANPDYQENMESFDIKRRAAETRYHNKNVEFYLPKDHAWVSAIKFLKRKNG